MTTSTWGSSGTPELSARGWLHFWVSLRVWVGGPSRAGGWPGGRLGAWAPVCCGAVLMQLLPCALRCPDSCHR